jgi:hypothetical protein
MIALERNVGSISAKIVMEIKARAIEYLIVSVNWHNQIVLFCARVVIGWVLVGALELTCVSITFGAIDEDMMDSEEDLERK